MPPKKSAKATSRSETPEVLGVDEQRAPTPQSDHNELDDEAAEETRGSPLADEPAASLRQFFS